MKRLPNPLYEEIERTIKPYLDIINIVDDENYISFKEIGENSDNYFFVRKIIADGRDLAIGFELKPIDEFNLNGGSKSGNQIKFISKLEEWCKIIEGYSRQGKFKINESKLELEILNDTLKNGSYPCHKDLSDQIIMTLNKLEAKGHIMKRGYSYKITKTGLEEIESKNLPFVNLTKDQNLFMKEIFISYKWESNEHNDKVISFCNFLREKGYHADMDRKLSQEETSINLSKMMHLAITDYSKIIVILSKGYKDSANSFKGGVGNEFSYILTDIIDHPKKYILVSFYGISDEIIPLAFKSREVIDLGISENINRLFLKLNNTKEIEFSPIGSEKPAVETKKIPDFFELMKRDKFEIHSIVSKSMPISSQKQAGLYKFVYRSLAITIKNISSSMINGFDLEVSIPYELTKFETIGRLENDYKIFEFKYQDKVFSQKSVELICGELFITNETAQLAFKSDLTIKIFSEIGNFEMNFPIKNYIQSTKDFSGEKYNLSLSDFGLEEDEGGF